MTDSKPLARRSFLKRVTGTVFLAGTAGVITGCASAGPGTPGWTGLTDNDGGPAQDRRGFGRGHRGHTGITDSDSGYYQDAPGNGRGTQTRPRPQRQPDPNSRSPREIFCTDHDSNSTNNRQDPTGYGRCRYSGS